MSTALVLPGGGARGAYQAGVLSRLAELLPEFEPGIITGVSAGAINAAFVANHSGGLRESSRALVELWSNLQSANVVVTTTPHLLRNVLRWGTQLVGGGAMNESQARGLLDTSPLQTLLERELSPRGTPLPGVQQKLNSGRLRALAVTVTSYDNGKAVTLADVADRPAMPGWTRPYREGRHAKLTAQHVMASCAIPILFPAIHVDGQWCGDGSVRQMAPLSPAVHLGATRVLVVAPSRPPAATVPPDEQYPSPARVAGVLLNALMFDSVDYDVTYTQRITRLVSKTPDSQGLRAVEVMVVKPSEDLGGLAANFEHALPPMLRYLTRGWGTLRSNSSDILATLLFESEYTRRLIELGRADVDRQAAELTSFLS